jgi:nitronate monooxygenase
MAGGPTTPTLVAAVAEAGGLGVLAGGYLAVDELAAQMAAVRTSSNLPFGVNLFLPGTPTADRAALAAYLAELEPEAAALGVTLGDARFDDDQTPAKLELLLADPPALVSFTFGCPDPDQVRSLQVVGVLVAVTVTSVAEARQAVAAGADLLVAQGTEAGGHRAGFVNGDDPGVGLDELLPALLGLDRPVVAAGAVMSAARTRELLEAGAVAVQCGTAFLRSVEAGTHPVHRAALAGPRCSDTVLTRAFSGRLARGLRNRFVDDHPDAPAAYPEIHHATRPLRARAAAVGDADRMALWAGTGFRQARDGAAGEIVEQLTGTLRPPSR